MAQRDYGTWVQLASRIPKSLHRRLKIHCVTSQTSVMDFVLQAVEEQLARERGRRSPRP